MKIVTFNIRCDYNQDGNNSFQFRQPLIIEKINKEKPDIICFQEVLPHVATWLKETFLDYYMIGIGRSEDYKDEQVTIAYKKDSFNLMDFHTFWLSPAPYTPGSRYKIQSICPRTCAAATFQLLNTSTVFRVYNTHLDHESSDARMLALSQIQRYISKDNEITELPCILLGDFNAEPDSPEIIEWNKNAGLIDLTSCLPVTYHEFGQVEKFEKIDYIYISTDMQDNGIESWTDCNNQIYLSDHYPICANISFKK